MLVTITNQIFHYASCGLSAMDFLCSVSKMLLEQIKCDSIELRIVERNKVLQCKLSADNKDDVHLESVAGRHDDEGHAIPVLNIDSDLEKMCLDIVLRRIDAALPCFTEMGSFWLPDTNQPLNLSSETCKWAGGRTLYFDKYSQSIAIIPFEIEDRDSGLLFLKSRSKQYLTEESLRQYEELAKIIGIALFQLRAQVALRERVKELTCLFGISTLARTPDISIDEIMQHSVELLPPGWLYQEHACGRIILNGNSYSTATFREGLQTIKADIIINSVVRGRVEVAYTKYLPELDEGPFLNEERNLIEAIAKELALIIENKQIEEDKRQLQEQLRHADRLATIGQLSAGIAHELNEPLAAILGLSQLIEKNDGIPEQIIRDNKRIIAASLHARKIIDKLKLFARQTPVHKKMIDINQMISDGLYWLESRCQKAGIQLTKKLSPNISSIWADSGQLYQVLVNLVVNAVQATPAGGNITIETIQYEDAVGLCVSDTGSGMDDDIVKQIFTPFFTSKDVTQGTGLGLAVVHGIVKSHNGTIDVKSQIGKGSRFEVRLPVQHNPREKRDDKDDE